MPQTLVLYMVISCLHELSFMEMNLLVTMNLSLVVMASAIFVSCVTLGIYETLKSGHWSKIYSIILVNQSRLDKDSKDIPWTIFLIGRRKMISFPKYEGKCTVRYYQDCC